MDDIFIPSIIKKFQKKLVFLPILVYDIVRYDKCTEIAEGEVLYEKNRSNHHSVY